MTGIFSNDTYNNGVTRDDFEQYAHTYYNPRDPYNGDYIIQNNNDNSEPITPKPKKNNNNNNKGNNKAGILGGLVFLAIVIFIVLFSFKMYYAAEEITYYQGKIDDANEQLKIMEDASGQTNEQNEYFVITDKEIDTVTKATEIINAMNSFDEWCTNNFETHAPQCYYIYEEFLIENDGIISQIENVINN